MDRSHYWSDIITAFLFRVFILLQTAKGCEFEGNIRLVDGQNEFEGRVEVCKSGQWKTVCNRDWGNEEAAVVCRQIGRFSGSSVDSTLAVPVSNSSIFGESSYGILRVRWKCNGNEKNLLQCRNISIKGAHRGQAGVHCYDNCSEEIRLIGGHSNGESGRVEVCLNRYWGTVCDDGWDSNDATTVCRQLGYNDLGIPTRGGYFGEGSGPIHLSRVQCKSNDTRLTKCTKVNTGTNDNHCKHTEDAGVICKGTSRCGDGDVRLVGGENEREGRVEICYNRVWGTVCDYGWDEVDASVVCTQLGYGQLATSLHNFGAGEGPILLSNISCNQSNTKLFQCVHPKSIGIHNCQRNNTAGVICPPIASSTISDTTITTSSVFTMQTSPLSVTIGAVGGVLGAGTGMAISIAVVVVLLKKRRIKRDSMDNPTYDEAIRINPLDKATNDNTPECGTNFQYPSYSEIDTNLETRNMYKGLIQKTMAGEALYESIRHSHVAGALVNEEEDAKMNGRMEGISASEVTYDMLKADNDYDDICYSVQGQTETTYSEV